MCIALRKTEKLVSKSDNKDMKKVKKLYFKDEARQGLARGVNQVAEAVKVTLGPKGRLVLLNKQHGAGTLTKDGVSVAKEIKLADALEDEGAKYCIEVAMKSNTLAGDGTTTATVLAQALINEGLRYVGSGGNSVSVKKGMDLAVSTVIDHLQTIKKSINDPNEIKYIATISGNDVEVGSHVSDAFIAVGSDGVVTFEPTKKTETSLELVKGMKIDRGMPNPYFATDSVKRKADLLDPLILLWGDRINDLNEVGVFLNHCLSSNKDRPILIVSDDIDQDPMATIILNKLKGNLSICCVKAPGIGSRREDLMSDLAVLTGGKYFAPDMGYKLKNVQMTDLGNAKRVTVTMEDTVFIDGASDPQAFEKYIAALKVQHAETESNHDKMRLSERIAKLSGTVAVIKIGATTETELKEKHYRYEDAINATKAAMEEGIVPGGGSALLSSVSKLDALLADLDITHDEKAGINIVKSAIKAPAICIANNGGYIGEAVVAKTIESQIHTDTGYQYGFDAKTGQYKDMVEAGIIDPVKVTRSALENAASIAGLLLITETVIVDAEPDKPVMNPLDYM